MTTPSHKQHYRLSPAAAALYVGPEGEVIVQLSDFQLRVQDGVTPGGFPLVTAPYIAANFAPLAAFNALVADIAPVGLSGVYADLTGKPTLFDGAYASLTGKPTLFDGAYASLSGKPTLGSISSHNVTISTSGASGGADGDIWFRYS